MQGQRLPVLRQHMNPEENTKRIWGIWYAMWTEMKWFRSELYSKILLKFFEPPGFGLVSISMFVSYSYIST
jgi:hypothetical protein